MWYVYNGVTRHRRGERRHWRVIDKSRHHNGPVLDLPQYRSYKLDLPGAGPFALVSVKERKEFHDNILRPRLVFLCESRRLFVATTSRSASLHTQLRSRLKQRFV